MCRSSQPKTGLTGTAATPEDDAALLHVRAACARSSTRIDGFDEINPDASLDEEDEVLFSHVDDDDNVVEVSALEPTSPKTRRPPVLRICDCRPVLNAKANAAMGKGHEVTSRLGGDGAATLEFFDVQNIHAMRKSFEHCAEACSRSDDDFWADVHSSRWLHHIGALLRGAAAVARHLDAGDPVLVHCSDGWDRTAQICGLAQLLLDPYFRTRDGFRALIEKDFGAFGYMFRERSGLGVSPGEETGPIFLQFLDAVGQLLRQNPTAFAFTDALLDLLRDASASRFFGDFLRDCDKDRQADAGKAASVWSVADRDPPRGHSSIRLKN